ncbi:MAG TPA: alpha/beta hydrolase [Jatrophihabitans sp.]|jgi:pimeloyl-ACP methyl ester carboxylesterase
MKSTVPLPDGRDLEIYVTGPAGGVPLVVHHGTPGSYVPIRVVERAAHAAGLRFVSYSRAGYGASSRRPGRSVVDVADDVAAILDHLGAPKAVTAGSSGGGPHALATAALLPERITGVTILAGVAPYAGGEPDFMTGMGEQNVEEFGLAIDGEVAVRSYLERERPGLLGVDPAALIEGMSTLLPQVDRDTLTGEFGQDMVASFDEALRPGVDGWVDDDLAFVKPWGFDLASLKVPVFVWQGDADLMVPFAHGQWLAANILTAVPHLVPGQGHLSINLGFVGEQLAELTATIGT